MRYRGTLNGREIQLEPRVYDDSVLSGGWVADALIWFSESKIPHTIWIAVEFGTTAIKCRRNFDKWAKSLGFEKVSE